MLLELLQHHPGLFLAAVEPFICARKVAELASLSATCRQLWDFLAAGVPLLKHMRLFRQSLRIINSIDKIIYIDDNSNLSSIMYVNGIIRCYVLYNSRGDINVYGIRKFYNNITCAGLKNFGIGIIDTDNIHGPIRKFIDKKDISLDFHETILDIKIN
jgi:hypothetical protein